MRVTLAGETHEATMLVTNKSRAPLALPAIYLAAVGIP